MSVVVLVDSSEMLQILLDLADHPADVASTSEHEKFAVVVPDELHERYLTYQSLDSSTPKEPKKSRSKQS